VLIELGVGLFWYSYSTHLAVMIKTFAE
jgi:hypothetical protein